MSTHPYIPLYVDDYEAATAHLTPEEDGIYNRLLRLAWRTPGCALPTDPAWLARKIRLSAEDFVRVAQPVLDEFFMVQRGKFVQRRLKREYDDISRKKSARKQAGKKGGAAKAQKLLENSASNATLLLSDTRAFPYPEPEPYRDANASPDANEAKASRKKPERPIPAGFPAEPEIETAEAMAKQAAAALQVRTEAERFRNHAEQNDRRCRDWTAAWRNWVSKAIERAPKRQPSASAPSVETVRASWEIRLGQWAKDRYWDEERWGPRPGLQGCRVPEDMLPDGDLFERRVAG